MLLTLKQLAVAAEMLVPSFRASSRDVAQAIDVTKVKSSQLDFRSRDQSRPNGKRMSGWSLHEEQRVDECWFSIIDANSSVLPEAAPNAEILVEEYVGEGGMFLHL